MLLKLPGKAKGYDRRNSASSFIVKESVKSGKRSGSPWNAVSRKHANQLVTTTIGGQDKQGLMSVRNVSKLTTGLLVGFRGFQSMIRRSFQLSGSYDVITTWEDLQSAVMSTPKNGKIYCTC